MQEYAMPSKHPSTPKQAARRKSPIDSCLDPEFFKALGDPTRVGLLCCLAKCGRACGVSEMAACCEVDLSVVSRHLSLLARAGVVEPSKKGRAVEYRVRFADLAAKLRAAADAIDQCCPADDADAGACCGSDCCK